MIIAELKKHPVAYTFLLISILAFVWGFFQVWPNRSTERLLVLGFAAWYVGWGVITHRSKGLLSKEVIKEYSLVAALGAALLLLLTV